MPDQDEKQTSDRELQPDEPVTEETTREPSEPVEPDDKQETDDGYVEEKPADDDATD
jgi:hypothetical protein